MGLLGEGKSWRVVLRVNSIYIYTFPCFHIYIVYTHLSLLGYASLYGSAVGDIGSSRLSVGFPVSNSDSIRRYSYGLPGPVRLLPSWTTDQLSVGLFGRRRYQRVFRELFFLFCSESVSVG